MRRWGWRTTRNRGARCFPRREGFWTGAGSVDAGVSTTGAGLAAGFLRLPLLNCFSTTSPSTPACFRLRSPMCLICALRARNLAAAKIDDAIEEYLNDRNPRDPPPEFPATSQIDGELRELRVRFARTRYRVLYQRSQNLIVLLHAFEKNTGTVSASDRQKAERRMADFRARMEERPRRPLRARSHPGTSRASSPYVTQCGLTARRRGLTSRSCRRSSASPLCWTRSCWCASSAPWTARSSASSPQWHKPPWPTTAQSSGLRRPGPR